MEYLKEEYDAYTELNKNSFGTPININDMISHTATSNGIIYVIYASDAKGYVYLLIDGIQFFTGRINITYATTYAFSIKKGMEYQIAEKGGTNSGVEYIPYV